MNILYLDQNKWIALAAAAKRASLNDPALILLKDYSATIWMRTARQ